MTACPDIWLTAQEIADLSLPGLPATKRGVNRRAADAGWHLAGLVRRKRGAGGGMEYHLSALPAPAQAAVKARSVPDKETVKPASKPDWQAFDALPETAKARAADRLAVLDEIDALENGGLSRLRALKHVAASREISERSVWGWFKLVSGVDRADWLPALAPKHRAAARACAVTAFDPEAFNALYADFMRVEQPSFASCYRRVTELSRESGWSLPPERTARRRFEAEVPAPALVLARKGVDALKRMYPPQEREKSHLHALEIVNADGHRFDNFVMWPDGTIARPMMTAFQDVMSGLMLSWRIDVSENRIGALLAFGDMVEAYGIPDACVLDNGRGWASKWLTGGTPTRYRFKVKDDDPLGVLPMLGVDIHWTLPYSGQSKPIERAFRDLCDSIAKHPRLAGCYTGNKPDAKPENYGSRAAPLDEFMDVLARGMAEHNTRVGRRSAVAAGRSFKQVFETSYAQAPIRKASEEQRRLWLLAVEGLRGDRETGALTLHGSRFWSDWCWKLRGEKVTARFDPEDLTRGLHVYAMSGEYLGEAAILERGQFLSLDDAQAHARARTQFMKSVKAMERAQRKMTAAELAARHAELDAPEPSEHRAKVVRPVFEGNTARALDIEDAAETVEDLNWFRDAHARGLKHELTVVRNEED